jgi:hypothetical protein
MKHNPISRLLDLFRQIPRRRPLCDVSTGRYRPTDLLRADSVIYEPGATDFLSRTGPDRTPKPQPSDNSTTRSRTSASTAAFGERSLIVPTGSLASLSAEVARWPDASFRSRKEARRLRVLDQAIAEIARYRRPR